MGLFSKINALRPPRTVFDLSYNKAFDCEMGQCIPIMCDEVVPGDKVKIGNEFVVRFQPTVAPIPDDISVKTDYFFVSNRLVFNKDLDGYKTVVDPDTQEETLYENSFENFITRGFDGDLTIQDPKWIVSDGKNGACSLWDYFGLPVGKKPTGLSAPTDMIKRAYNLIWNEYYRDENLQEPVDIKTNEDVLYCNWAKDYFSSALPFQSRGSAPALPVVSTIDWSNLISAINGDSYVLFNSSSKKLTLSDVRFNKPINNLGDQLFTGSRSGSDRYTYGGSDGAVASSKVKSLKEAFETVVVKSTAFNVPDLRLAFQIQKWQERNSRGGVRYTEFLRSHFAVAPRDDTLQRPLYLGGTRTPVITTEVLQTSESGTTPQGNFTGHLLTADASRVSTVNVNEYGWIIGIMRIVPKARYTQGIDRQFLRHSPFDYYFYEFANLSEQAVLNEEIFCDNGDGETSNDNRGIFGYIGAYDEMRFKPSKVVGNLRGNLDYWTLARKFESRPHLNSDFIKCVPSKRIFAVTSSETPAVIVNFYNKIKALRPLPYRAEPGLIDHH